MATNTTNYSIVKPAPTETYSVAIVNSNSDIIDTTLYAKVDKTTTVNAKPLSGNIVIGAGDIPNSPSGNIASNTVQGAINELDIEKADKSQFIEKTSYGVYAGLGVTQQATPNMTVSVATGTIYMVNGDRWTPTANTALAVTTADATNPRIDIVYVNSLGVIAYLAGTPGATPVQPSTPAGGQLLASILVTAGKTSILTADISDKRRNNLQEAWIVPTLTNNWVYYGSYFSPPNYYKDQNGIVKIKGVIKSGITTSGTVLFSLPVGYRPLFTMPYPCMSNDVLGQIHILNNGQVRIISGSSVWFSIDVSFRAEQ